MGRLLSMVMAAAFAAGVGHAGAGAAEAQTLKWGSPREIGSLDPYSYGDTYALSVLNHVYEGLVRYNGKQQIEPALATAWTVVSPTIWRFTLRQGVTFHDGAPFGADDIIASLERITHPTSPMRGELHGFKSARKVDASVIEIELDSPNPLLLNDLTNVHIFNKAWLVANNSLLPTDAGKGVEGFATNNTNGTGPFKIVSRRRDTQTVFIRNAAWWDKPVHNLERIEFVPIVSAATRVAAMLSGEIDFTNAAPLQDLSRLSASPDIKVLQANEVRSTFFGFNWRQRLVESDVQDKNPLRDIRVREAMYRGIDIAAIQSRAMRGLSRSTGALVAPSIPGFTPELDERLPFDAAQARRLLAEAGYPNGFSFLMNCASDALINEEEFCQAVASMWSRIGLRPNLSIAPRSQQTPKRVRGEFDVVAFGWANEPTLDSSSLLTQVIHKKDAAAGVFNWGEWGDDRIDALNAQAAVENDAAKRTAMLTAAMKIAKDQHMFLPLHQQPMAWAARSRISSLVQNSDNKPRMWLTVMK